MKITNLQLSVIEYTNKVYAVMGKGNVYYIGGAPNGVAKLTFDTTYTGADGIFTLWHSSDGEKFSKSTSYINFTKESEIVLGGGKGAATYYKITATLDGNEYESEVSKALIKNTQPNPPTIDKLIYIPCPSKIDDNVTIPYGVDNTTGKNITVRYGYSPLDISFDLADGVGPKNAGKYWTKTTIYVIADDGLMTSPSVQVELRKSNKKAQITKLAIDKNRSMSVVPFRTNNPFNYYSQVKVRVDVAKGDEATIDYATFYLHELNDNAKIIVRSVPYRIENPEIKKDGEKSYFEGSIQLVQHSKSSLYKISCSFHTNYRESSDEVWFGSLDKVDNFNEACVFCCLKKPTEQLIKDIFSVKYDGSQDKQGQGVDEQYNKYAGAYIVLAPTIINETQIGTELTQLPYCTFSIGYKSASETISNNFNDYDYYSNVVNLEIKDRTVSFITPYIMIKFNENIFTIYGEPLPILPPFFSEKGIKMQRGKWKFFEENNLSFSGEIQNLNYAEKEISIKWNDNKYDGIKWTREEDNVNISISNKNNTDFLNSFRDDIYKIGGSKTANLSLIITDVFGYESTIKIEPFTIDFEIAPSDWGDSAISFLVRLKGKEDYEEISGTSDSENRVLNKGEELKIKFQGLDLSSKIDKTLIKSTPKIVYNLALYEQENIRNLPTNSTSLNGKRIATFSITKDHSFDTIEKIYEIPATYDNMRLLYATVDAKIDDCSTKSSLLKITNPANTCVWVGIDNNLSCNCSLRSISDDEAVISIANFNFGDSRYINRDYKNHRWPIIIKLLDENKNLLASESNLEITGTSKEVELKFPSKINGMTGRKHFYIQIDFINNEKEIDDYGISKEVIYVFDSPLISGRPSTIGINAFLDTLDITETVVAIGATQSKNQLILIPSKSEKISTINIDTGEMTNFIINCGTWDD